MLDSDVREKLYRSRALVSRTIADFDPLVTALREMQSGYPSGHEGSGEPGDQTTTAALQRDPAYEDRRRLNGLIDQVHARLIEIDDIRHRWTRSTHKRPTGDGDPGCEVVGKAGSWEPALVESTDVKGNLSRKYRLGRWAYDFVARSGRLPSKAETEAHLQGRAVRAKERRAS